MVKSVLPPRSPAAPPQPMPIEHSSAFLIRSRRDSVRNTLLRRLRACCCLLAKGYFAYACQCLHAQPSWRHSPTTPTLMGPCVQEDETQEPVAKKQVPPPEAFSGSAVKWALMKADESLDEIEENPPEAVKVIYDISRGPVGGLHSGLASSLLRAWWMVLRLGLK